MQSDLHIQSERDKMKKDQEELEFMSIDDVGETAEMNQAYAFDTNDGGAEIGAWVFKDSKVLNATQIDIHL